MNWKIVVPLFSFMAGLTMSGYSQTTVVDLSSPLLIDPEVKTGKLDNGLVYYIRHNKKPEHRVELRLVVNAGSILENDNQQGLAHFMEHMNFNGTKNFPKNELIDFLQKTGVRFGADINAYTSFDETVYQLQLPTDDTTLVNTGLQVLEDWAHQAMLESKEIDKERGVIIEEWRMGLGAQDRMMKKFLPIVLQGSRYAERLPIGKIEILEKFKPETLRSFYSDWYRPDLQAIVVVGDIDPAEMEMKIKARFGPIPVSANGKIREEYDIPDNQEPLIAIATDPEATQNSVLVFYKHPVKPEKNLGDFRERILGELYTGMLNQRFQEIAQKPSSPYVYAGSGYGRFLARSREAFVISALSKENQIGISLETILGENERVRQSGFTPTEFERQKEVLLNEYEKAAKEFDKTESAVLTSGYVDHYLNGNPIPGAVIEFEYVKKLLPDIHPDQVNELAKRWITENNLVMVVMAPEKEGLVVPSTEDILASITNVKTTPLEPYVDHFRDEPLVEGDLPGSTIIEKKEDTGLGFTELTLSNGVTVVLKPTIFKNDEILISAYSLGGNSLYPDHEFVSANFAASVINQSGAGNFEPTALQKKLKGKNVSITPYIEDVREGFTGNTTPEDLCTLMELVYLYFEAPRKDTTAFQTFVSKLENQMKFMKMSPVVMFYDTLFKTAYPGYPRLILFPTLQQLEQIDLNAIYDVYTDRFADASDFHFFLVGNFQVDSIIPLLETYLGSLPSLHRNETWEDRSPQFAPGITDITFYKGTDPQSMVGIAMSEEFCWNEENLLMLTMLKEILSIKLTEVIREKLSGVYSPQIMLNIDHYPKSGFSLAILFGCSPKTTGKLTKAVFGEIKKIQKKGPTEVDLNKVKEILIRKRETDLEQNRFWLSKLESLYFNHDDPGSIASYTTRVGAVTTGDVQKAAGLLIDPGNYIRVVLKPEKK